MEEYKEVHFHEFCKNCKYYMKGDMVKEPCDECLSEPINLYSHKPVKFEEKVIKAAGKKRRDAK